jgi:putative addiction module component (TIGR02574 family)
MGNELNGILEKVLNMPQQQRAFLAGQLIDSLEPQIDMDIETAWQNEIHTRVLQAKEGSVIFMPWEEARRRLKGE